MEKSSTLSRAWSLTLSIWSRTIFGKRSMNTDSSAIIEVEELSKAFRSRFRRHSVQAVFDLNLRVERGSVVAFVGPNRAGKPTTGLDPEGRKLVAEIILEEKNRGTTVFLSSHILSDVERTCDHVVILREGSVAFSESMASLRGGSDEWEIEMLNCAPRTREAI